MEAYSEFASVYDELMDNVPYESWCDFVVSKIEEYGVSKPAKENPTALESERDLILDLGCGTGTFTRMLQKRGYDMMGIDLSEEMLQIAMERQEEEAKPIMYLLQDMRELELYCTVGTVVSVCDSVNYILEEEELLEVFKLVNNYLFPGGLFIFDFNTLYKYKEIIGDTTIAENREDCSFIWENFFYEDEAINEYDLTMFLKKEGNLFEKQVETHYQRGYTPEEMRELIERSGLQFLEMVDADTKGSVTETSQRVYVLAKECTKQLPEEL